MTDQPGSGMEKTVDTGNPGKPSQPGVSVHCSDADCSPVLRCESTSAEEFIRSQHAMYKRDSHQEQASGGEGDASGGDTSSTETTEGADPPDLTDVEEETGERVSEIQRPTSLRDVNEKPLIPGVIPLHVQSDQVEYVAANLEEQIRLSSPHLKEGGALTPAGPSRSVASSMYSSYTNSPTRTFHPDLLPAIDPSVLEDIEGQSYKIADSLHLTLGSLSSQLHNMSALTVGCLETYRDSVHKTSDNIDGSIKSMYALMAKCEELGKAIQPIYKMQEDIKEINRLLDVFESKLGIFPSRIIRP